MTFPSKNELKDLDKRCECGKLLLKLTSHGFEFKCNRCKRLHLLKFDQMQTKNMNLCLLTDPKNS